MRTQIAVTLDCPWCGTTEEATLHLSITHYQSGIRRCPVTAFAVARPDRSRVIWTHDCAGPGVADQGQEHRDGDDDPSTEAQRGDLATLDRAVGGVASDSQQFTRFRHGDGGAVTEVFDLHDASIETAWVDVETANRILQLDPEGWRQVGHRGEERKIARAELVDALRARLMGGAS